MTDPPLTTDAAVNRLLVAAYGHCMSDVASMIDALLYVEPYAGTTGEPWKVEKQDLENLAITLRSMLVKASAFKTILASDKVEALLTLANVETPDAPLDS